MKIEDIDNSLSSLNSNLTVSQAFERGKKDQYGNIALVFLVEKSEVRYFLRNLASNLNRHKRLGQKVYVCISNPSDKNWMVNLAGVMADDVVVFVDDNATDEQKNILLSVYPNWVQFDF